MVIGRQWFLRAVVKQKIATDITEMYKIETADDSKTSTNRRHYLKLFYFVLSPSAGETSAIYFLSVNLVYIEWAIGSSAQWVCFAIQNGQLKLVLFKSQNISSYLYLRTSFFNVKKLFLASFLHFFKVIL